MVRAAETMCVGGDDVVSMTSNTRGSVGGDAEPAATPATETRAPAAPPVSVPVLAVVLSLAALLAACTSADGDALDEPEVAGVLTTRNGTDDAETDAGAADAGAAEAGAADSGAGGVAPTPSVVADRDQRLVAALPTLGDVPDGAIARYEAMAHITDPRRPGDVVVEPCGVPILEAMAIDARTSAFSGGSGAIDEVVAVARLVADDAPLLTDLVADADCDGATVDTAMGPSEVAMLEIAPALGSALATGWAWYPAEGSTRSDALVFYVFDAPPLDGWLLVRGLDGDAAARAALVDSARPIVEAFADHLAACSIDLEVCAAP